MRGLVVQIIFGIGILALRLDAILLAGPNKSEGISGPRTGTLFWKDLGDGEEGLFFMTRNGTELEVFGDASAVSTLSEMVLRPLTINGTIRGSAFHVVLGDDPTAAVVDREDVYYKWVERAQEKADAERRERERQVRMVEYVCTAHGAMNYRGWNNGIGRPIPPTSGSRKIECTGCDRVSVENETRAEFNDPSPLGSARLTSLNCVSKPLSQECSRPTISCRRS